MFPSASSSSFVGSLSSPSPPPPPSLSCFARVPTWDRISHMPVVSAGVSICLISFLRARGEDFVNMSKQGAHMLSGFSLSVASLSMSLFACVCVCVLLYQSPFVRVCLCLCLCPPLAVSVSLPGCLSVFTWPACLTWLPACLAACLPACLPLPARFVGWFLDRLAAWFVLSGVSFFSQLHVSSLF